MKGFLFVAAATAVVGMTSAAKVEVCTDSINDLGIDEMKLPSEIVAGEKFTLEFTQ